MIKAARKLTSLGLLSLSFTVACLTPSFGSTGAAFAQDSNLTDTDGDGLPDVDEDTLWGTDSNNADTDGDGLSDGDEVKRYGTDPTLEDTDNDGMLDDEEVALGADPHDPDTDDDYLLDGEEGGGDIDNDGIIDVLDPFDHDYYPGGGTVSCAQSGPMSPWWALLLAIPLFRRRKSAAWSLPTVALAALGAIGSTAQAQEAQEASLNVQRFEPSGIASGFGTIFSARTLPVARVGAEIIGNYGYRPYQRSINLNGDLVAVDNSIAHLTAAHLRIAAVPTQWLQIGVRMPVFEYALTQGQFADDLDIDYPISLGDITAELDFIPLLESRGVGLSISPFVTIPLGNPDFYLTHNVVTLGGRVALSGQAGPVHMSAFSGYRALLGPQKLEGDFFAVDDQVLFGAGVGVYLFPEIVRLNAEFNGHSVVGPSRSQVSAIDGLGIGVRHTPMEAGGSLVVRSHSGFGAIIGAMGGLTPAPGAPVVRAYLNLGYAPLHEPDIDNDGLANRVDECPKEAEDKDNWQDEDGCPELDNDQDNIADTKDMCPNDAEDYDSFDDDDGCPDNDNDLDRVVDAEDACPDTPEDRDMFEDEDGCPDPDNDQDGIADLQDMCRDEPEDFDGFFDTDGCPEEELDRDADGIVDVQDACPDVAEDVDGFQDQDGCPDLDNDADGIADVDDLCPMDPENINGTADDDGCPDSVKVVLTRENIVILEKIQFYTDEARLRPVSFPILDNIYQTLVDNPQVESVRIEGHTDWIGSQTYNDELSARRAESVREYLVSKGISESRLIAEGFGETYPIATNRTEEGREKNRRVEFVVLQNDGEAVEQTARGDEE